MATREQIPTLAGELVKHQSGFNALSTADAQAAILDMPAFIDRACNAWAHRNTAPQVQETESYLKLISGAETLTIDACEDSPMTGATDVFDDWIDPDFENYECDSVGQATPVTNVQVYEMINDGDFKTIYFFNGMCDNLNTMCLTKGQIKNFVKKYRNWLRTDGYGTFFLFKANNQFFVAVARFASSGLSVGVSHFSRDDVWDAEYRHRFVLPQLNLGN